VILWPWMTCATNKRVLNLAAKTAMNVFTQSANFPQRHSICPHIGGSCKLSRYDGLNGHPLEREPTLSLLHIHLLHLPWHAKVGDLQLLVFTKENVTTGQVTMDDVQTGKVLLGWKGQHWHRMCKCMYTHRHSHKIPLYSNTIWSVNTV